MTRKITMIQLRFLLLCGVCLLVVGCAEERSEHPQYVALGILGNGKEQLNIQVPKTFSPVGPNGFQSPYGSVSYVAELVGDGPVYENPHFIDYGPYQCIGTITLDRDKKTVTVNMQRIVSKPGEPQKTEPHPVNGTYKIDEIVHGEEKARALEGSSQPAHPEQASPKP